MAAILGPDYRWRDLIPRRTSRPLPPGQRVVRAMPRFGIQPRKPPPLVPDDVGLDVGGDVAAPQRVGLDRLATLPRVELTADFHCVTTWTVPGLAWSGWWFRDLWERIVVPAAGPATEATHVRARGGDGYFAVLDLRDALADDVLVADRLAGRPLDPSHGAPLRLVSPAQYAYKSVKHLASLNVHTSAPRRHGGAIEHPRARVAHEERHASLPGRLLRWPYRALILPTSLLARRSAR